MITMMMTRKRERENNVQALGCNLWGPGCYPWGRERGPKFCHDDDDDGDTDDNDADNDESRTWKKDASAGVQPMECNPWEQERGHKEGHDDDDDDHDDNDNDDDEARPWKRMQTLGCNL